jgi:hypothetical protein
MIPVRHVSPKGCYHASKEEYEKDEASLRYVFRRELPHAEVSFGLGAFPNMWFLLFVVFGAVNAYFFVRAWNDCRKSHWGDESEDRCACYKQRVDFAVVCLAQILIYSRFSELAWTPLSAGLFQIDVAAALATLLVELLSLVMMGAAGFLFVLAHCRDGRTLPRPRMVPRAGWLKRLGWGLRRRWRDYTVVLAHSKAMSGLSSRLGLFALGGFWIVVADCLMFLLVPVVLTLFIIRSFRIAFPFHTLEPLEVIRFERTVHLSNGVSPLLPRLLFSVALFAWGLCLVRKLYLANHYAIASPFPEGGSASFRGLRDLDRDVRAELMPPSTIQNHCGACLAALLLMVLVFFIFWHDSIPPVDGWWFGFCSLLGFCVGSFFVLFTLLQFWFAWRQLRKMLRYLALLPMQNAFERLSEKVVAVFGNYLFSLRPRPSHMRVMAQQFEQLRRSFPPFRDELRKFDGSTEGVGQLNHATLRAALEAVDREFPNGEVEPVISEPLEQEDRPSSEIDHEPPLSSPVREWGGRTGESSHLLARRLLCVLRHFWPAHTMTEAFGSGQQAAASEPSRDKPARAPFLSLPEGHPIRVWVLAAEDFVAIEIVRYLSQFIVQLRNLLNTLTISSLLLLLAATVYPFFPQHQLLLSLTVLAAIVIWFMVSFLFQLNKDELVSRITRTTPNRFTPDWTFVQATATYVLPILAAFMIQFPFVTSTLRSLFDPLFHIIK